MSSSASVRRAARAIVLDPESRLLLFRGDLGDRPPWWFAPGGRIEEGESATQALRRELAEEIGLDVGESDLGAPVWLREAPFIWRGQPEWHVEEFFVVRVPGDFAVDTSGFTDEERLFVPEHRWWRLGEIAHSAESFAPRDLGARVEALLRDGLPAVALEVGE